MPETDPYAATAVKQTASPASGPAAGGDPYAATAVQVAGPQPNSSQPAPVGVLRAPTDRERFLNPDLYPVGQKGEGVGENLKNLAQRGGVGIFQLADAILNPGRTVRSMASSILPDPIINLLNKSPDAKGRELTPGQPNLLQQAYQALITSRGPMEMGGKAAPLVGQSLGGEVLSLAGPELAGIARAPRVPDSVPRSIRPLIEKTEEAQRLARESADEYANDLRTKLEEIARQQADARKTAKAKAIEDQRVYQEKLAAARTNNTAALRAQSRIAPTQAKLDSAVQEMQAQIETARERARAAGNKYFNAVNSKLNPLPADMESITSGLTDSIDKIKGTESEPTVLKAISKRIEGGDALTYNDLQGFYSELGNELSKGTLPGDIYTAYDTMHEAIGADMQRIADSQGMGKQLLNARNYWRRMKQTFGKPYNPTDAANLVLDKTAGSVAQRMEQANRLRLLGSFDRTIPQTALHIANLQKGVAALPKEAPVRAVVQQLPTPPGPASLPRFEGTPEELAQRSVRLPKSPGKTVIDQVDIEAANRKAYAKGLQRAEHWTLYLGVVWPAIETLRYLIAKGQPPSLSAGLSIGSAMAARVAMDRIFTNPHVVDFFTKATPKEIAAVPPELRGDLPKVVAAAQSRGVRVSPALMALAAAGVRPPSARSASPITPQQAIQAMQPQPQPQPQLQPQLQPATPGSAQ
jgi:hypothetical protein